MSAYAAAPIGPLLPRAVVAGDYEVVVARPVLALTLYLDRAERWASEWAPALLERFLFGMRAPVASFRTSNRDEWRPVPLDRAELVEALRARKPRHLFRFRVVDDEEVPTTAFAYREVDPRRSERTGHLQIVLPLDTPPEELLALAIEICQLHEVTCGVGGYAIAWNEDLPRNSFEAVYSLTKRYWGLDVQLPDAASAFARTHLPSVSWLTILGSSLLAARGVDGNALSEKLRTEGRALVLPTATGLCVRTGDAPELGDVNLMEHPFALGALGTLLASLTLTGGFEFPGPFSQPDEPDGGPLARTDDWRGRFVTMEGW